MRQLHTPFPLVNLIPTGTPLDDFSESFMIGEDTYTHYPFVYKEDTSYNLLTASHSDQALQTGVQDMTDGIGEVEIVAIIVEDENGALVRKNMPRGLRSKNLGWSYSVTYDEVILTVNEAYGSVTVSALNKLRGYILGGVRENANRR